MSHEMDSLKSRIDHPAGRHRYWGPHQDDHRVGHARPERDVAPGDTGLFDALGLALCLTGIFFLIAVGGVLGWHTAGTAGAIIGAVLVAAGIHLFIRSLS
jgi:hypothetical protein